jgi:hypothetical protein
MNEKKRTKDQFNDHVQRMGEEDNQKSELSTEREERFESTEQRAGDGLVMIRQLKIRFNSQLNSSHFEFANQTHPQSHVYAHVKVLYDP